MARQPNSIIRTAGVIANGDGRKTISRHDLTELFLVCGYGPEKIKKWLSYFENFGILQRVDLESGLWEYTSYLWDNNECKKRDLRSWVDEDE